MKPWIRAILIASFAAFALTGAVCAFGWYAEKADIDRRQVEAEERFEANLEKWKAEEAAKKSPPASPQPAE